MTTRAFRAAAVVAVFVVLAAGCTVPTGPGPDLGRGFMMRPQGDVGFLSMPWPNDVRKSPSGTLDLSGLPGVNVDPVDVLSGKLPVNVLALPEVVSRAAASVSAFGTNSAVFVRSSVPVDPATLPDPVTSTSASSTVMLIDLDHDGERFPVLVEARATGNRFRPDNTLIVLPYPGHPLRSASRYALVIFDGVRGSDGDALEPAPLISALDQPWTPDQGGSEVQWSALRTQRDEVRATVASTTSVDPSRILAFSVFSTQDVHREMDAVASAVAAQPPPTIHVTSTTPCPLEADGPSAASTVTGTIEMPRFQEGTFPYLLDGGSLSITDGVAVAQSTTPVPVSMSVPCSAAPAGGWPAVTYIDGTAASGHIGESLKPFGFAHRVVAEIPPLYSGTTTNDLSFLEQQLLKLIGASDQQLPGLLFFNLLNPVAARTNVFQQAANNLMLVRALRSFSLDGAAIGITGTVDGSRVSVAGHSQGAQTLPLVAAADPAIAGVFSSAGSGGYYHQFAHEADKRALLAEITGDAPLLDELTPLVQVAQTTLEAADPANYPSTMAFLNVSGIDDGCVSVESARHYSQATGLASADLQPPTSLYGAVPLDPPTVSLPAGGNSAGRTRINVETNGGHESAFSNLAIGTGFLDAVDAGITPIIPTNPYPDAATRPVGCSGRWDPPSNRFGE